MVSPFSSTKVRLPQGFQSLLVGLSTEVLRQQPRNIPEFAAQYFERMLQRREHGELNSTEQSTVQGEHHAGDEKWPGDDLANDPTVQDAATKIQAQFRGYKVRRNLEKRKDEVGGSAQSKTDNEESQKSPSSPLSRSESQGEKNNDNRTGSQEQAEEELTEDGKLQQARAAVSIQAQFRGYQVRKNLRETSEHAHSRGEQGSSDNAGSVSSPLDESTEGFPATNAADDNDHNNRPQLEREPTQLSDDFARHRRTSSGSNPVQQDDDMNDSDLDKAATRIQASYRGYKTRKELGSGTGGSLAEHEQNQPSSDSLPTHDEHARNKNILSPSAEGNKGPVPEEEDNAAAVKIQAAYRGYRVRKDLDK